MGYAKDAETLSVHVSKEIVAEIKVRADALGQKKGTYATEILEWWWENGCPPVKEADRLLQISRGKIEAKGKAKAALSS